MQNLAGNVKQSIDKLYQAIWRRIIKLCILNLLDPCNKAAADKLAKANFVIREKAYLIRAMQLELERQNPDDNRFM